MDSLITISAPTSQASEEYKKIRTHLLFRSPGKPIRSILITSTFLSISTELLSSNLSVVFAQLNLKVALVDANFLQPYLHKLWNTENKIGFETLLTNHNTFNFNTFLVPSFKTLYLIPLESKSNNIDYLFTPNNISDLLSSLYTQFDIVIFNASPLLKSSNALTLAIKVDGVILSLDKGRSQIYDVQHFKKIALQEKINIISSVLNN